MPLASLPLAQTHVTDRNHRCPNNLHSVSTFRGEDQLLIEITVVQTTFIRCPLFGGKITFMYALIDYDNLRSAPAFRARPKNIFHQLAQMFSGLINDGTGIIHARFYGGWRLGYAPSYSAQGFTSLLEEDFPLVITAGNGSIVRVKGEMATDLLLDKGNVIPFTFRKNPSVIETLRIDRRFTCAEQDCPVKAACEFVESKGACSRGFSACGSGLSGLIFKDEQKIVDTAIVSDMQHISTMPNEKSILLISSDDDLYPGVLAALVAGKTVLHGNPLRYGSYSRLAADPGRLYKYKAYSL